MRYRVKMIDLQDRVVASTIQEVTGLTLEGLKLVERSQNEVLQEMGFKGRCELETIEESGK